MAISITEYHSVLDEIRTAITASDWATANKKFAEAEVVLAGLETMVQHESALVKYRESLSNVGKAIARAQESTSKQGARSRMIRTQVGYGR